VSGVTIALRTLHHGESRLERELLAAAARHRVEHEICHVATDVARWSREHAARLADIAQHYDLDLVSPAGRPSSETTHTLREKTSEPIGRRPEPGLLLLCDLRDLHLAACENSLYWEMLAQAGQASKDTRLQELAAACHPQTLRQIRWTNTTIKVLSPQILTSL
jgi:hypothetical protein